REGRAIRWRLLSDGLQRHMDLGRVELAAGITAGLAMAYDEVRGNSVIFGGGTVIPPTDFNDTWVWDGTTWTQLFPATSPSARSGSAMAYDVARGRVVVFGGADVDGTPLGDTWTWDGATWLLQAATVALSETSLKFGVQLVGTRSAAQSATLTNTGTTALTISSIAAS